MTDEVKNLKRALEYCTTILKNVQKDGATFSNGVEYDVYNFEADVEISLVVITQDTVMRWRWRIRKNDTKKEYTNLKPN